MPPTARNAPIKTVADDVWGLVFSKLPDQYEVYCCALVTKAWKAAAIDELRRRRERWNKDGTDRSRRDKKEFDRIFSWYLTGNAHSATSGCDAYGRLAAYHPERATVVEPSLGPLVVTIGPNGGSCLTTSRWPSMYRAIGGWSASCDIWLGFDVEATCIAALERNFVALALRAPADYDPDGDHDPLEPRPSTPTTTFLAVCNLETGVVVWHTRAPRNAQSCYRVWACASGTRFVASLDTDLVGYKKSVHSLNTYTQEFRLPGQGGLGARCAVGEAVLATGNTHSEDIFTWRIVPRPSRADSDAGSDVGSDVLQLATLCKNPKTQGPDPPWDMTFLHNEQHLAVTSHQGELAIFSVHGIALRVFQHSDHAFGGRPSMLVEKQCNGQTALLLFSGHQSESDHDVHEFVCHRVGGLARVGAPL